MLASTQETLLKRHEEVKRTTMTKDRNLGFFQIEHTCNISETPKQGINSGEYYVI
jgi:hypothetical protein